MFKRIKELREYEGLTQKEIAKQLKVSRSTYGGWESGKDMIPLGKLNELANFFHVTLDSLIGSNPEIEYEHSKNSLNKELIAHNIKSLRKSNNLSQEEFAKSINTSQANIHKYESGKSLITTYYALELSKKYHYSLDKLTGRKSN